MLRLADAVLGNSSSGLLEAAPLGLPVVNVGERQRGRLRFGPVADVPVSESAISTALGEALMHPRSASELPGGYPAPPAAPRIVEALRRWAIPVPPRKRFHEAR